MQLSLPTRRKQVIVALAAMLLVVRVGDDAQAVTQPALRAAFLYKFATFTEWPPDNLPTGPLTLCVIEDSEVEGALSELVGNSTIKSSRLLQLARIFKDDRHDKP